MTTTYMTHPLFQQHEVPDGHPERPRRLSAIDDRLNEMLVMPHLNVCEAEPATRRQLERVHTARLIDELQARSPPDGLVPIDPDTFIGPQSLNAAWHAAGAAALATRMVLENKAENAFCAVRPPGHHAERDQAMGFCLFNNVAVAAASALEEHGLDRVAILDFDVHHGNGTQNIFAGDERVLFCSAFQHPFYPFIGTESAQANIVNVPLPAGTRGPEFRAAIVDHWLPAVERHRPQMIFVSAGFDGHAEDELAHFFLKDDDYDWVTRTILALAENHCDGRVVSCLEGGYALGALSRCAGNHVRLLARL